MNTYKRHRFPPDIISYAVWLYYRFNLSHRDVEDLLAERGIVGLFEQLLGGPERASQRDCVGVGVSVRDALAADVAGGQGSTASATYPER